jgi:hypothetical protein
VRKRFIGVISFFVVVPLVFAACGSSGTTTSPKTAVSTTTTAAVQPMVVLSATGPLQPVNPGGPTVQITLENVTALFVTSLSAVFTTLGSGDSAFTFAVSDSAPLRAMANVSATQTLINASIDNGVSYPLEISGTMQNGTNFDYVVQVQITAPSS